MQRNYVSGWDAMTHDTAAVEHSLIVEISIQIPCATGPRGSASSSNSQAVVAGMLQLTTCCVLFQCECRSWDAYQAYDDAAVASQTYVRKNWVNLLVYR